MVSNAEQASTKLLVALTSFGNLRQTGANKLAC